MPSASSLANLRRESVWLRTGTPLHIQSILLFVYLYREFIDRISILLL